MTRCLCSPGCGASSSAGPLQGAGISLIDICPAALRVRRRAYRTRLLIAPLKESREGAWRGAA